MSSPRPKPLPGPAPEKGRDAILSAATQVFAGKGYGEARIDEIAARAGVNKAMLYYHVGGKEELYGAVVARVLDDVVAQLARVQASPAPPEERFRALVAAVGRAARDVPEFPVLILREVADGGVHLPPEVLRRIAQVFGTFRTILAEGRAAGAFIEADPLLTHMLVGGSLVFLAASQPLRDRLGGLEPKARLRRAPSHPDAVADLLLHGLAGPKRPKGATR